MTSSPSETSTSLETFADEVAAAVGGSAGVAHGTAKIKVSPDGWKAALTTARDDFDLVFFSWLSATDWANDVAVGDTYEEQVEERYEMLCAVSTITDGTLAIFSADLDKAAAAIDSVADVYPGANWHEREAAEMFGIDFTGHPDLERLYLPDGFEGHPLKKSYSLLSREVKPWPGKVDVEVMPSTENPDVPPVDDPPAMEAE